MFVYLFVLCCCCLQHDQKCGDYQKPLVFLLHGKPADPDYQKCGDYCLQHDPRQTKCRTKRIWWVQTQITKSVAITAFSMSLSTQNAEQSAFGGCMRPPHNYLFFKNLLDEKIYHFKNQNLGPVLDLCRNPGFVHHISKTKKSTIHDLCRIPFTAVNSWLRRPRVLMVTRGDLTP